MVFSGRNSANELAQRAFKVNTNLFFINLRRQAKPAVFPPSTDSGASVNAALRQLFGDAGVDMKSPRKAVFYSQKTGWLFVKATVADMDLIEKVVVELNNATPGGAPPLFTKPEIHLKARFLEVPRPTLDGFEKFLNGTNLADGKLEGILSVPNAKNILQALQSRRAEVLGEPEITVANGRRLQMRATQIVTIVTNLAWQANSTNQASPGIMPQTEALETGPVLDATATILADDYTIHLSVKASLTEFLGYDQPETGITNQYISYTATSPVVWPDVQVRSQSTDANLDDGQTILLSLDQSEQLRFGASSSARDAVVAKDIQANLKRNGEKPIIVFITATLVDQAGNRIHSDNDPAFPPDQIPAQPVQSK